ncbi:MAG: hypothetical protein RJA36_3407 [Pseudomonadota bacterium]|jgi:hypothetical protein
MAFAESFTPYLVDFGVDGTLAGEPVRVLFDAPVVNELGDIGVMAAQPQVIIATASLPVGAYGSTLVVPAGTFTVREVESDGTGLSLVRLSRAA